MPCPFIRTGTSLNNRDVKPWVTRCTAGQQGVDQRGDRGKSCGERETGRGGIITAYNRVEVRDPVRLRNMAAGTALGTEVTVSILRDKETQEMQIAIGELPKTVTQACGLGENKRSEHALAGSESSLLHRKISNAARLTVAWWSLKWFVNKLKPLALVLFLIQQAKATIFRSVKPK